MSSELTMLTMCTCPGHELVFECITDDGAATIWHGTALDECDSEIHLRHSQFNITDGYVISKTCGAIGQVTGRAVSAQNQIFVSHLTLNFSQNLSGSTVICNSNSDLMNNYSAIIISYVLEDQGIML